MVPFPGTSASRGGSVMTKYVRDPCGQQQRGPVSGEVGSLTGTVPGNPWPPTCPRTHDGPSSRADWRLLRSHQKHCLLSFQTFSKTTCREGRKRPIIIQAPTVSTHPQSPRGACPAADAMTCPSGALGTAPLPNPTVLPLRLPPTCTAGQRAGLRLWASHRLLLTCHMETTGSVAPRCWEQPVGRPSTPLSKHLLNKSLGGLTLSRVLKNPQLVGCK